MSKTNPTVKRITTEMVGKHFLKYYEELGYSTIPGSSLLDNSVPMSFVMSAGMVQFERLSNRERNSDHFCLIQNCFRYFDLDQIGSSKTHLSLFQMPGAFAFGPVDRKTTIAQIWELLTKVYGFNTDSLFATYFAGGLVDGKEIPSDTESALAWRSVGLSSDRIIGLSAKYNFWSQTSQAVGINNSRKRGPNTEVFFDRGLEYSCGTNCFPGCPCGRFIEFLNALFITYKIDEKTHMISHLEEPFTEVVIGLERATMILQSKAAIFEIDSVYPIVQQLRNFSKPLQVEIGDLDPGKLECILVDHIRALLFLVVDGAPPPGKGGRARLMRILARELLNSQRLLGISDSGFLRSMILAVSENHHQLLSGERRLLEYLAIENERFEQTVQTGMHNLDALFNEQIREENILMLKKTRGLPPSLLKYQIWRKKSRDEKIN